MQTQVTLQMAGRYPDISSGCITFENAATGEKVIIAAPKDLELNTHGISSITMDVGANYTIFPASFAPKIGVEKPPKDEVEYFIFSGVGGTSVGYLSPVQVIIGVEDGKGRLARKIFPFFLTRYAPSITSEGRLLGDPHYQPYGEDILPFISPPFRYRSPYRVEVRSPRENFPPQDRRLGLEVDIGEEMDYILIGRDWQAGFQLIFEAEEMIIKNSRKSKSHKSQVLS